MEINVDDTECCLRSGNSGLHRRGCVQVEVDPFAIGYTSLGSVTDAVKAIDVNGVAASLITSKTEPMESPVPSTLLQSAKPWVFPPTLFLRAQRGRAADSCRRGLLTAIDGAEAYTASGMSGTLTLSVYLCRACHRKR
jgi:hypothetical protein